MHAVEMCYAMHTLFSRQKINFKPRARKQYVPNYM